MCQNVKLRKYSKKTLLLCTCLIIAACLSYWGISIFMLERISPPYADYAYSTNTILSEYSTEYFIRPGESLDVGYFRTIKLLEIISDEKSCRMELHNQSNGQHLTFWATQSEFVKGVEDAFGTHGLRILRINEDSVTFEIRSGQIKNN